MNSLLALGYILIFNKNSKEYADAVIYLSTNRLCDQTANYLDIYFHLKIDFLKTQQINLLPNLLCIKKDSLEQDKLFNLLIELNLSDNKINEFFLAIISKKFNVTNYSENMEIFISVFLWEKMYRKEFNILFINSTNESSHFSPDLISLINILKKYVYHSDSKLKLKLKSYIELLNAPIFLDWMLTLSIDGIRTQNESKSSVFFLGESGAGKSTLINLLLGEQLNIIYDNSTGQKLVETTRQHAAIGHNSTSCTTFPYSFEGEKFNFCDLPGFNDTRKLNANLSSSTSLSIPLTAHYTKNLSGIIIILNLDDFYNLRYSNSRLTDYFTHISKNFNLYNTNLPIIFVMRIPERLFDNPRIKFIIKDVIDKFTKSFDLLKFNKNKEALNTLQVELQKYQNQQAESIAQHIEKIKKILILKSKINTLIPSEGTPLAYYLNNSSENIFLFRADKKWMQEDINNLSNHLTELNNNKLNIPKSAFFIDENTTLIRWIFKLSLNIYPILHQLCDLKKQIIWLDKYIKLPQTTFLTSIKSMLEESDCKQLNADISKLNKTISEIHESRSIKWEEKELSYPNIMDTHMYGIPIQSIRISPLNPLEEKNANDYSFSDECHYLEYTVSGMMKNEFSISYCEDTKQYAIACKNIKKMKIEFFVTALSIPELYNQASTFQVLSKEYQKELDFKKKVNTIICNIELNSYEKCLQLLKKEHEILISDYEKIYKQYQDNLNVIKLSYELINFSIFQEKFPDLKNIFNSIFNQVSQQLLESQIRVLDAKPSLFAKSPVGHSVEIKDTTGNQPDRQIKLRK